MTNEEAREQLKDIARSFSREYFHDWREALDMAIKALEQQPCIEDYPTCTECEHYDSDNHYCPRFCQVIKDTIAEAQPCEDCISRKMAVEAVAEALKNSFVEYEDIAKKIISKLPSVTPQPKTGKWIVIRCEPTDIFKCSECGMRVMNPYRYCHNCGARMGVEDEDSD